MTAAPLERVGLIGLGEVGQVLAEDLAHLDQVQVRAWDRLFPVAGSVPWRALQDHLPLRLPARWPSSSAIAPSSCVPSVRTSATRCDRGGAITDCWHLLS